MDVVLALVAALLFAFGTVLLQRAGLDEGEGGSSSDLLLRMARRPVWLAGIAAEGLGFVFQAIALSIGRLAVVQPLLVSAVVFALPLGARITGQRVRRSDIGAALLVTAALIIFLTVTNPSGGTDDAPVRDWLIAGGVSAALVIPLYLLARTGRPAKRAALLGTAAGVLFALSAALTKAVADEVGDGFLGIFVNWHLYALLVVGYVSMTLNQLALGTGALAPAVATSMATDPIGSVVLGVTLLNESMTSGPVAIAAMVVSLGAALVGVAILSRAQDGPPASKPLSGRAVGQAAAATGSEVRPAGAVAAESA